MVRPRKKKTRIVLFSLSSGKYEPTFSHGAGGDGGLTRTGTRPPHVGVPGGGAQGALGTWRGRDSPRLVQRERGQCELVMGPGREVRVVGYKDPPGCS